MHADRSAGPRADRPGRSGRAPAVAQPAPPAHEQARRELRRQQRRSDAIAALGLGVVVLLVLQLVPA